MKKACREAGISEERHAKRQAANEAGIYRGTEACWQPRIMRKRQALRQAVGKEAGRQ